MDLDQTVDHVYNPFIRPREIRIAVIEPSTDYDAPLRFSFQQALLEDLEGQYEAISYVWGAPILTFPVHHITDGSQICVTENLDKALRRRRHRSDCRWLWADAMCIDQQNDREKEMQIPMMVNIYRGAKRVLAWIHEGDEATEKGMRYIDRLSRQSNTCQTYFVEDATDHSVFHDVAVFINLPYFRRLSIVQEIVFSLDITLICGKSQLSWIRLAKGLTAFQSKLRSRKYRLGDEAKGLSTVVDLWRRNSIAPDLDSSLPSQPHHEHILDLVITLSEYGCTDARDRIFAVHALSHQNHAGVAIDYTLDVYAAYRRFALACMADGRTRTILYAAGACLGMKPHTSWPSWLPGWRCMPALVPERDGRPLIEYVCELNENIIELEVSYLLPYWQEKADCDTQPLIVCTEEVVSMDTSLFVFFYGIIMMYERSYRADSSIFPIVAIFRLVGIEEPDLSELRSCLELLCEQHREYTKEMREYEELLEHRIAELTEGCCWFTVKFKGRSPTYFCCGRVIINEGDTLMAVEMLPNTEGWDLPHRIIRTIVLRPTNVRSEKETVVSHCARWTATTYQTIGEAWLVYPWHRVHSLLPLGDVRIYLC